MVSRSALILDPKTNGSSSFFCSALDSPAESDVRVSGRKKPVRILIADDHEAVRRGLRTALSAAGWEVCADVVNGKEAVAKASELKPDLIIGHQHAGDGRVGCCPADSHGGSERQDRHFYHA
jgi:hypothetical protein